MSDDNNKPPLELIRQKERDLAERLKLAECQAKQKVAGARQRATALRQEAEMIGRREAELLYQDQISRAQEAAVEIGAQAKREATELARRGEKQLEHAVQSMIEFILPK